MGEEMCLRETNEAGHSISWMPAVCFASSTYALSGFTPSMRRLAVREADLPEVAQLQ